MKEHLTVITRKGQITLPAEVRRAMGLRQGDRVTVILENNNQARVTAAGSVVDRTAGVAKTDQPALTAEQLRDAAEVAWAEDAAERDE
jgi:antitoxin PrlF